MLTGKGKGDFQEPEEQEVTGPRTELAKVTPYLPDFCEACLMGRKGINVNEAKVEVARDGRPQGREGDGMKC